MLYQKPSKSLNQQAEIADLVATHHSLVARIAHHLAGRLPPTVQVEDLIQAGMIGLIEASQKYDSAAGASFSTYAGIRIRGAMLDEVRRGEWAPRSVVKHNREILQAMTRLEQQFKRSPTDQELATELGVSLEQYQQMLSDALQVKLCSLDEFVYETGATRQDQVVNNSPSPELQVLAQDNARALAKAIEALTQQEQLVLSLYYYEEMNLREIAAVLEVSESRVSQIHGKAALKLRKTLLEEG